MKNPEIGLLLVFPRKATEVFFLLNHTVVSDIVFGSGVFFVCEYVKVKLLLEDTASAGIMCPLEIGLLLGVA